MDTKDAHFKLLLADRLREEALRSGRPECEVQIALVDAEAMRDEALHALAADTLVAAAGNELVARDEVDAGPSLSRAATMSSKVTTKASVERLSLIASNGVFDLALDTADSVGATTATEKMIAHGAAAGHKAAMDLLEESRMTSDPINKIRHINAAARLLTVVQQGALALQRLRTGGAQTVTVRHVTIENGGQAVIGNVGAPDVAGRPERN